MRITLAQVNTTVGDVAGNVAKIKAAIDDARKETLVVFPEMVVTGYPLEDLVFSQDLQMASQHALHEISTHMLATGNFSQALIGYLNPGAPGERPRNSVALVSASGVMAIGSKLSLPTYGVFDEARLFTPGDKILTGEFQGSKFAAVICEDVWLKNGPALTQAREAQADVLFVINGSPFEVGKREKREEVMANALHESGAKLGVYVNLVGGQDDLVFDGGSFVYDGRRKGKVLQLPHFQEHINFFDLETLVGFELLGPVRTPVEADLYSAAVLGLRDYVLKNGFKSVLVGVSGGIDSALVTAMAADALGGTAVRGVSMPSGWSSQGSLDDAQQLMLNVDGAYEIHSIAPMMEKFQDALMLQGVAKENLQARIRGTILMGMSNASNALVLTPGNKSELAVGYSTLYGDTVGGYAPLKDMYKTQVYAVARWRNSQSEVIPPASIEKPPSAELSPGQVDQDSLPDYDVLDAFLKAVIETRSTTAVLEERFGTELTLDLLGKIRRAEWKRRQYPVGPKMNALSFGRERVMPITSKHRRS